MLKQARAFTLIELLITVVIASILLTIAVPSYRDYVARSRLSEAFDALSTHRLQMEQAFLDTGNYGTGTTCAIPIANTPSFNTGCILSGGGLMYTATASSNGVKGMAGYSFTINNNGIRVTNGFPGATVPVNCWLTRKGGC